MAKPLYIHRYTLQSRSVLNSRSERSEYKGVLIRKGDGIGCVHPWTELGDPSLESLIESLRDGDYRPALIQNAMECVRLDGEARQSGVALFDGVKAPDSHATLVDGESQIEAAVEAGFRVMKLKAGRNLQREAEWLDAAHLRYPDLRWRLDFNQCLDRSELDGFVNHFSEGLVKSIDFLEDPCSEGESIDDVSIALAVDREVSQCAGPYKYAVVKPAGDKVELVCQRAIEQSMRVVFTSYMDHPIGQSYAAYVAGKISAQYGDLIDAHCGLMTHGLFEPDAFTEALGKPCPEWSPAEGTGLGFDTLIEQLDWERLI
ncbi:enolase C-terminal domain-like protein [Rubritalea sp.]|uniref:enolase C-terminal domain-like protein n=1 Tax=Rubritalea sp. TaxID=2109375 RepID=UPI003EF59087